MKVGRNDPCPCGSGKKYKRCCGREPVALARPRDPLHAAYDSVLERLQKHAFGRKKDPFMDEAFAHLELHPGTGLHEWEGTAVPAYLLHGHRGADGRRAIDVFTDEKGARLSPLEAETLDALRGAWPSLFEIEDVHLGQGFDARDLVLGERIHVHEISATSQLRRWDLYFGWVQRLGGRYELTGGGFLVPRMHRKVVLEAFLAEAAAVRRRRPGATDREVFGEAAWAPHVALRRTLLEMPRPPQLRNFDDEEMLFCEARYPIDDTDEIRRRLAGVADLEPTDDGFVWLDRQKRRGMVGEGVSLGAVRFGEGELVLETNSRERLARLQAFLTAHLAVPLGDPATSKIEHPKVKIEEARRRPRDEAERDDFPPEVKSEVGSQMLAKYYAEWLDTPVPALGGKTPRRAVRSKTGRGQVAELLKDIENSTLRMPGGEAVDFDGMRRELGLVEEAPWALPYDANAAPTPAEWLAADEGERIRAVEAYHARRRGPHPETKNPRVHATIHAVVENQIAAGDPPEVGAAVEHLVGAGCSRHEAVHAVASVVAEEIRAVVAEERTYNRGRVAEALASLDGEAWRGSAP